MVVLLGACGGEDGGSCPSYMQIAGGEFSRTPTRLTWAMELAGAPDMVTFDQADVPPFVMEYEWSIEIDVDNDATTDLNASINHFRQMNAPETITADVLSLTTEGLWTVEGAGVVMSGDIFVSVAGNTFTFEIEQSEDPGLANVTEGSQSTWKTFHKFGPKLDDQCEDSYRP